MCMLYGSARHVYAIWECKACVCYMGVQGMCMLYGSARHVYAIWECKACVCYMGVTHKNVLL